MNKERTFYFDILNILATFSVVLLHCNSIVHTYSNTLAWKESLVVEVIAYWAVPVFYMLTGATLINYRDRYTTKEFFKKRILKIGIPFFIWNILYLILKLLTKSISFSELNLVSIVNIFINSELIPIYWFFIPLFMIYLSIPIIYIIAKENRKYLYYMFFCSFITISIIQPIFKLLNIGWNKEIEMPLVSGYLLYPIIGYLIATEKKESKRFRIALYCSGIICLIFRYVVTYYCSTKANYIYTTLFSYKYFTAVIPAISVFIFFKNMKFKENIKVKNILKNISSCSFGVYLIHYFIIGILLKIGLVNEYSLLYRTLGAVIIYLISLLIVWTMKKIPILNKLVP